MKFRVAICDDEKEECYKLSEFLRHFELKHEVDFEITEFNNGRLLLEEFTEPRAFDILLLDVEMPGFSGLEIAEQVRRLPDKRARIIFISNYPKYMQDSFNVQAFQYLQKPLGYTDFENQLERVMEEVNESFVAKTLIGESGEEELVALSDIYCFEAIKGKKNLMKVYMLNRELLAKGQIVDWEKDLAEYSFVSPHRGFLVNLDHIHYFKEGFLELDNGMEIPFSRRKEREIRARFSKRIIKIRHYR